MPAQFAPPDCKKLGVLADFLWIIVFLVGSTISSRVLCGKLSVFLFPTSGDGEI